MITWTEELDDINLDDARGFFAGWPRPPSGDTFRRLLEGSDLVQFALDDETSALVGFATAITDGVLCAYIPLVEVLESHQGRGIGRGLVQRLLDRLTDYYMVDVVCDPELVSFYEQMGMHRATAAILRRPGRINS